MLNFIWCFFIIISIIYGIVTGNFSEVNNSIFESIESTIKLLLSLLGNICFWNGIMNILKNTNLIKKINYLIGPLVNFLFPDIDKETECYKYISMNITSNLLGLGNSSTPCGLKAIEEMQKFNFSKNKLSKDQFLFILINTASIQLIPTTIISIRTFLGSKNPTIIIFSVWFTSFICFILAIFFAKLYFKIKNY